MTRRACGAAVAALAALAVAAPATYAAGQPLNAYRVKADPETLEALAQAGYDVGEGRRINGRWRSTRPPGRRGRSVATVSPRRWSAARGRPRASAAAVPEGDDSGYDVWTRSDAVAGDDKEQYEEQYDRLAAEPIVKKISLGQTDNGRDIWALKVTKDAKTTADNTRPAVLYNAIQHAREWLAGETCRRTLDFFVDNYGRTGNAIDHDGDEIPDVAAEQVTALVDSRELWFMCVANPDGYEYTFTPGNRLWRKNLRDNNADGRSRSATAWTRTATTRRTGASTRRARRTTRRRRPTAAPAPTPRPRPRR